MYVCIVKNRNMVSFLAKKVYVSSVSYLPTCIARLPRVTHIEQQKELVKLNLWKQDWGHKFTTDTTLVCDNSLTRGHPLSQNGLKSCLTSIAVLKGTSDNKVFLSRSWGQIYLQRHTAGSDTIFVQIYMDPPPGVPGVSKNQIFFFTNETVFLLH